MNSYQQHKYSSREVINLTLICVFRHEHRNRVKLITVAPLPIWHEKSRVCDEGMMEDENEVTSKEK